MESSDLAVDGLQSRVGKCEGYPLVDRWSKYSTYSERKFFVQSVWAINPADEVFVRSGLSKEDTKGKEWTKIDGSMKTVRYECNTLSMVRLLT